MEKMYRTLLELKEGKRYHAQWPYYLIGEQGEIYSERKQGLLTSYDNAGYRTVYLFNPDTRVKGLRFVHRLVADVWVPNPEGKPEVNHKDGDKLNNHYTNLEWVTHAENIQHSYNVLGRKVPSGKDHWRYGTTLEQSTKDLMSQAKIGENHPKFKGWYVGPDGYKHASAYLAAKVTGMPPKSIWRWAHAEKNGWRFKKKV